MRRLRQGERLALLSGVALAVLLALDWFFLSTPDARIGAHESGIRSLGWFAELLLIAAILASVTLTFLTLTQRPPAHAVIAAVVTWILGLVALIVIAVRLIWQPTLGVDATAADVDVEIPAFLGLVAAAGITLGGWLALADERTEAKESVEQTEDVLRVRGAPRPAPEPQASGGSDPLAGH